MTKSVLLLIPACLAFGCSTPPAALEVPEASPNRTLHQFSREAGTGGWAIENDSVMGGISRGQLEINEAGNALFTGEISLENDGGFSSIQCEFPSLDVSAYDHLCLGLKGDGKRYQIRVESSPGSRHAYAYDFPTTGDWQTVVIPFEEMYAIRHGDRLDLPPYPGQTLALFQLLAGDGRAETFRMEIDRLWLQ